MDQFRHEEEDEDEDEEEEGGGEERKSRRHGFVDFENVLQSTIALNTLQDYRFEKHDKSGLKISYAKDFKDVSK